MVAVDNGVPVAGAMCKDDFNNIMKAYTNSLGGGWTPSGFKMITGQIWFEIALPGQ
jgi:hypothetical protein